MSYLQIQRNRGKPGRQFAYVHLTRSVWNPAKRRSVQQRVYVGRLESSGERLWLSKGFGGRGGTVVALAELRRRLTAGEDVAAWLRAPAAGTYPLSPVVAMPCTKDFCATKKISRHGSIVTTDAAISQW
jgi:hypothetical protein